MIRAIFMVVGLLTVISLTYINFSENGDIYFEYTEKGLDFSVNYSSYDNQVKFLNEEQ